MMKKLLLISLISQTALAGNYFKQRGYEWHQDGKEHRGIIMLQPTYYSFSSEKVKTGPNAGRIPTAGTIRPNGSAQEGFVLRRGRVIRRGKANQDIDYFTQVEFGQNGLNNNNASPVQLLDASLTFRQFDDYFKLRVGQFLFSHTSQFLSQPTPWRRVHVEMPQASIGMGMRRVTTNSNGGSTTNTEGSGIVNGGRDQGVEIFNVHEFGNEKKPYEFTWAFARGNGRALGQQHSGNGFRNYGFLSLGQKLDQTKGPRRHDWMLYSFYQKGKNMTGADINNPDYRDDEFYGAGFEYFNPLGSTKLRVEIEYMQQNGYIWDGPVSAVIGGALGNRFVDNAKSDGYVADIGLDIDKWLGISKRVTLNYRYDVYNRNIGDGTRETNFYTHTLTGEYFFTKRNRAALSFAKRDFNADKRDSPDGANAILENVGNMVALQFTSIF
jgi:hypothetical protein